MKDNFDVYDLSLYKDHIYVVYYLHHYLNFVVYEKQIIDYYHLSLITTPP